MICTGITTLRTLLFSILLLCGFTLFSQPASPNISKVPVYKSERDSARLYDIRSQLDHLHTTPSTPQRTKKLDSLISLLKTAFAESITGYRIVYLPRKDHVLLDSLVHIEDLSGVTKVTIHNYAPDSIPDIIYKCRNIESLELINTGIRQLPEQLNGLTRLKSLAIYNPLITRKIKLQENTHIRHLVIRTSHPKGLPRSYHRMSALETLDLAGNALERFPKGARHNKNLRELNLQNNNLTLRRKLKKHPFLETLALQHNDIHRVPKSIRAFKNLRKLTFNYNQVSFVHPAIGDLNKMENLSFYHNALSTFPPGVYNIKSLRQIDLFYNKIETVDARISKLENLKILYLSYNHLHALPAEIGDLSSLEGLYASDNFLETLPEELGAIKTLRFLWVNNNNLLQLPASLFYLPNIEELDVSHNALTTISESVFDFKDLKILSLKDNPWDKRTLERINEEVSALRARNIFVHITGE